MRDLDARLRPGLSNMTTPSGTTRKARAARSRGANTIALISLDTLTNILAAMTKIVDTLNEPVVKHWYEQHESKPA